MSEKVEKDKSVFLKSIKEKIIDWWNKFLNSVEESNFLKTAFINTSYFLVLYFNKDLFFMSYNESGNFSSDEINIIYNSMLFFLYIMLTYPLYLIYYWNKNRENKNNLSKMWFEVFIENEYKNNHWHFLDWIKYFITILLSVSAIYITIIAIQWSFDIANKIDWEYVNAKNTLKMLEWYYRFIWISISIFTMCFLWYRMNIQIKRSFIEKEYYNLYKKERLKN